MEAIFRHIVAAFDSLWKARPRGASLEVITPFPAAGDKYVSVFITRRDEKIIVTDGGYLYDDIYAIGEDDYDLSKACERIRDYYLEDFGIKRTRGTGKRVICFKATDNSKFVPNLVFEVANFVSIVTSSAIVPLREESETRTKFKKQATGFIKQLVPENRLRTNTIFTETVPQAKFSVIVKKEDNRCTLINLITGSSQDYMISSYSRSNTMFDLIKTGLAEKMVDQRIVITDDKARGFNEDALRPFFTMSQAKQQNPLLWSQDQCALTQLIS